ncbi:MAG: hypothetical protein AAGB24_06425 [Bacteroidota bacterium]
MQLKSRILTFSKDIKVLVGTYLLVTSIGFLSALQFVNVTTAGTPQGIQENYLGNEDDLEAEELKFTKSERQILNIVHAHMLSLGMLFLILAFLVALTPIDGFARRFLLFEPLLSVFFTFSGIYLLTKGIVWMKYIILISGVFMTFSYVVSVVLVLYWLFKKKSN